MNLYVIYKTMNKRKFYLYSGLITILFIVWHFSNAKNLHEAHSETIKIALREVGNQLLLSNKDSTSLVLPILELEQSRYQLSFQHDLSFEPSRLVTFIKDNLLKSKLPNNYLVEVIQCLNKEVAYSYKMDEDEEKTIIPCAGRKLPKNCYLIELNFTEKTTPLITKSMLLYLLIYIVSILLIYFILNRKKQLQSSQSQSDNFASIGSFQFYPEQNKLVQKAKEIRLSKKECELLEILVANSNQIVKREELEKKVWKDNGVVVGRSLDTYISKLRKKLKDDEGIKITNVHGVGYKLELA